MWSAVRFFYFCTVRYNNDTCAGNCLRCLCKSTIIGVLTENPLPECDGNATCTVPKGDPGGLCYKKLEVVGEEREGGRVQILTYSCADFYAHGLQANPKLCAGSETSGGRYKEVACCSGPDYCNAELTFPTESRSTQRQPSPEPSPAADTTSNQKGK